MFLLGTINVLYKDDRHGSPHGVSATSRIETLVKTLKSIGHLLFYDLSVSQMLIQQPASDPKTYFLDYLYSAVFYLVKKPWWQIALAIIGNEVKFNFSYLIYPLIFFFYSSHTCICAQWSPKAVVLKSFTKHWHYTRSCCLQWCCMPSGCSSKGESSFVFMRCVQRKGKTNYRAVCHCCSAECLILLKPPPSVPLLVLDSLRGGQKGYWLLPTQSKYNMQYGFQWSSQVTW